jgi:hypothetical protein
MPFKVGSHFTTNVLLISNRSRPSWDRDRGHVRESRRQRARLQGTVRLGQKSGDSSCAQRIDA